MCQLTGLGLLFSCQSKLDPPSERDSPPQNNSEYRTFRIGETVLLRTQDGDEAVYTPSKATLELGGQTHRVAQQWSNWKLFQDCLGSPLLPALSKDPESSLTLLWGERKTWALQFSGLNDCGLSGAIHLAVFDDRIGVDQLRSSDLPWSNGGREAYSELLKVQLRSDAGPRFKDATPPQRILILKRLSEDPDGLKPLQEIHALFPSEQSDIKIAMMRWRARFKPE